MKKKMLMIGILFLLFFVFGCQNTNPVKIPNSLEVFELGMTELIIDHRLFRTEDIPQNIPEEIVYRDFLYTITAEFDKKYDIYANTEDYIISIENEKRNFEESVFVKSYIIHKITTLTEEQYGKEKTISGERNPLFYWGWRQRINEFELINYQIVNVDFSVVLSDSQESQWGDGTFNRSFIVGKKYGDNTYRIYDFGVISYL